MPEKQLTESAWNAFAKKKSYKDAAFIKALAALAKAEKATASDQLEALADIEKQADALTKANKGDKELAEYLGDVDKALGKARKAAEVLAKKEAEDDEPDEPVLMTSKMVPLVRQLRKGDPMYVMLGNAGKQTAVLVMRKPIATTRRKVIQDYMQLGGGVKFIKGTALLAKEGGIVVFELETSAGAGMAKRVRQAIFDQTGQRLKLKCRAADTGQEEDDGEAAVAEDDDGVPLATPVSEAPGEQSQPLDPQAQLYRQQMDALTARITAVLKANVPEAQKIRAVAQFADGKAEAGDFSAATKSLDMLQTLLTAAERGMGAKTEAPKTTEPEPGSTTLDPAKAFNARLAALLPKVKEIVAVGHVNAGDAKKKVAEAGEAAKAKDYALGTELLDDLEALLEQSSQSGRGEQGYKGLVAYRASLVEFRRAAATVKGRIDQLRVAIPAELEDEQDLADELSTVLKEMAEDMLEAVDRAIEAGENEASPITAELRSTLIAFHDEVMNSELVTHVDANPFKVNTAVRETLGGALAAIRKALPTPA